MAERWQQWYPHDIDSWQGSANIQALTDGGYRAVHNLMQELWKQPTCSLRLDDKELAKRSRMGIRWDAVRDEVLDYFCDRTEDGCITHRVLFKKWSEAREVYEKRQAAAKKTNSVRSPHGHRNAQPTVTAPKASRNADTRTSTSTSTSTEEKQIPSRGKREEKVSDSRHVPFRLACQTYAVHKQVPFVWDASEAKALDLLLKAAPDLTLSVFQGCLNNRARSPGTPHGERPRVYLPHVLRYQQGPLNEFNRTEETGGANYGRASVGVFQGESQIPDEDVDAFRAKQGLPPIREQLHLG